MENWWNLWLNCWIYGHFRRCLCRHHLRHCNVHQPHFKYRITSTKTIILLKYRAKVMATRREREPMKRDRDRIDRKKLEDKQNNWVGGYLFVCCFKCVYAHVSAYMRANVCACVCVCVCAYVSLSFLVYLLCTCRMYICTCLVFNVSFGNIFWW